MKKFAFSMEKILSLREFEKKQAQSELGKAVAEETKIQETLELVAKQRVSSIKAADNMSDLTSLYNINQYLALLDNRKEGLLQQLTEAHMVTEKKRTELKEAMQKVNVLEKLKEAKFKAWLLENKKAEAKEIDDIVNRQFNNGN